MQTTIVPFSYTDGVPTLKDSEIIKIYHWIKNDKILPAIFHNKDPFTITEDFFVRFCKRRDLKMFLIFSGGKVAGLIWLDRIVDGTAMAHFTKFKWTLGKQYLRIYKDAVYQIFQSTSIDVLIGYTPVSNRLALKFIKTVGFQKCGLIPKALYVHKLNAKIDAYVSYAEKETFSKAYLESTQDSSH